MKMAKKTMALALAVMIVMTIMVVPASAASATWVGRFKKFAKTSIDSYQTGYTKAVQSILLKYNDATEDLVANSGGVDGLFGSNTKLAVEEFQDDTGIVDSDDTNYGKVNDATWGKMAEVLYVPSSGNPTLFRMNGRTAITAKYSGGVYNFYYHNTDGTEGSKFASVY